MAASAADQERPPQVDWLRAASVRREAERIDGRQLARHRRRAALVRSRAPRRSGTRAAIASTRPRLQRPGARSCPARAAPASAECVDQAGDGIAVMPCLESQGGGDRVGDRSPAVRAASSHHQTPSTKSADSLLATASASLVLPTPPGPVRVTSRRGGDRAATSRARLAAADQVRPARRRHVPDSRRVARWSTAAGTGTDRVCRPSAGSALRIWTCISCSAGEGSRPSSSASRSRKDSNAASASACRPIRYSASISCPCGRSRNGSSRQSCSAIDAPERRHPAAARIRSGPRLQRLCRSASWWTRRARNPRRRTPRRPGRATRHSA